LRLLPVRPEAFPFQRVAECGHVSPEEIPPDAAYIQ